MTSLSSSSLSLSLALSFVIIPSPLLFNVGCSDPGSRGGSLREPRWVAGWVIAGTWVGRGVGRYRTPGGSRPGFPWEPKGPGWVVAGVPAGTERAGVAAAVAAAAVENLPRFGLGSAGLRHHLSRLWQSPSRLGHRRRFHPPNFDYNMTIL